MKSVPTDDATAALVALRRIVRFLRLADRGVEAASGLSVAQLFVMHQLAEAPLLSIAELAERTLTDQSSVSTVVSRLVERGMIVRKQAADDARRAELRLSARGAKLVDEGPAVPQTKIIAAIRAMPAKRRADLVAALGGLVTAIGADDIAPKMLFEDEVPAKAAPKRKKQAKS